MQQSGSLFLSIYKMVVTGKLLFSFWQNSLYDHLVAKREEGTTEIIQMAQKYRKDINKERVVNWFQVCRQ